MLNILIISTSSSTGGAAIAAHRLMNALNSSGEVEAKMLVRDKNTADNNVLTAGNPLCNELKFAWERGIIWTCNRFSKKNLFQVSIADTGYDITKTKIFNQADIIHIHWTQQGMLSLRNLESIFASGKPIVWTMHDMWACTGICHYSEECNKYKSRCLDCQYLQSSARHDLSYRTFNKKNAIFSKYDFTVVTCSEWLHLKAEESTLLRGKRIVTIPNPIDTTFFCPGDKKEARKRLGLPENAKLVLFASQKVTDKRKGIKYLIEAAKHLKDNNTELEFVIMGGHSEEVSSMLPFPCHPLGYVSSPEKAALVYSACDLFVTPSLMDNLPNTIMEAMSCGTPCVGFKVGGIPEMIDHKKNGYVAVFESSEDLSDGINWVIQHPGYTSLCNNAREKVLKDYSEHTVARKFVDLYNSIDR